MSSKDNDQECLKHSKNDNTEIMITDKPDEVIEELFNHFFLDMKLDLKDKNIKVTINLINKNGSKCFLYAVTVSLIYAEIGKKWQGISKTHPLISKYN